MSIKNRGQDLKIASDHEGRVVRGGTGHILTHTVGSLAQADPVPPRRISSGSCVPVWRTRPSSACRCLTACATAAICCGCCWQSRGAAWSIATRCWPHSRRRRATHSRGGPMRGASSRHAALREIGVGTAGFTSGRDDAPEDDRRERHALLRASAPRNSMRDGGRLITACNGRPGDERAVRHRDTMRPSGGARDYAVSGARCRPFLGISMEITGNRPPPFCGKVVFATD